MKPDRRTLNHIKYTLISTQELLPVEESLALTQMLANSPAPKPYHWFEDLETVLVMFEELRPNWRFLIRSPHDHEKWMHKYFVRIFSPDYRTESVVIGGETKTRIICGRCYDSWSHRPARALLACVISAKMDEIDD